MGIRELENAILQELRQHTGVNTLKKKDLFEWSTRGMMARDGEWIIHLPVLRVNVAVYVERLKKKGKKA